MKPKIIHQLLRVIALSGAIITGSSCFGQDIQFSQFYAASLYQNPAFAGAAHGYRVSTQQRVQWPGLDAKYLTSLFSFDTYSNKYRSGFGLVAYRDWQGATTINSTDIGFQYAYEVHLSSKFTFRPGLQLSYVSRSLGYALTQPENFDDYKGQISAPSYQGGQYKQYADISSGGLLYNDNFWFGFSAHHMNTPNQTLIKGNSVLPVKYAFTAGYKIVYKKSHYHHVDYLESGGEYSITPTVHYKFQGKSDQLDIGLYGVYNILMLGTWFRGMPIKNYNNDYPNMESLVFLAGCKYNNFTFSYSYDFTISKLARAGTGGSHEIYIGYVFKHHKHYKPMRRLPCPNFNHH